MNANPGSRTIKMNMNDSSQYKVVNLTIKKH